MNPASVDIKDILAGSPLGLEFAKNLFVGKEPSEPDDCLTLFDIPGALPQLTMNRLEVGYSPSIQIRVRSSGYIKGWELINDVKVYLHGRAHETWNGTYYDLIRCVSEPFHLEWDQKDRAVFVTNFDMKRR